MTDQDHYDKRLDKKDGDSDAYTHTRQHRQVYNFGKLDTSHLSEQDQAEVKRLENIMKENKQKARDYRSKDTRTDDAKIARSLYEAAPTKRARLLGKKIPEAAGSNIQEPEQ